jgi:hypothetical protein
VEQDPDRDNKILNREGLAMSTHQRLVSVLFISILATACTATENLDNPACEDETPIQTHKRKFKVDERGCVIAVLKPDDTDGETVYAKRCDHVEWKITGKNKSVEFAGSAGSPFDWSDSGYKGRKISGQILKSATEKDYKYTVRTEGLACLHDPMIIVGR